MKYVLRLGEVLELYKHRIFINNKDIIEENFKNLVEVGQPIGEKKEILVLKKFKKINSRFYLIWSFRDESIFEENGEYGTIKDGNIVPIDEKILDQDVKKVFNYFWIFDSKNSEVYTLNTTSENSTVNKRKLSKMLQIPEGDIFIKSEVDLEETLKELSTQKLKITYSKKKNNLFNLPEGLEEVLTIPAEYFGGEIVSELNINVCDQKKFIPKFISIHKEIKFNDNIKYYIDAIDKNDKKIKIENNLIKKSLAISDDRTKIGNDVYSIIKEYFRSYDE